MAPGKGDGSNMKNYLIVVDMQTDFVDGALGTGEAVAIVPAVRKRIEKALAEGEEVIFTRDTHKPGYMETQEGRNLPVVHCVEGTEGWQIIPALRDLAAEIIDKPTFGSRALGERLAAESGEIGQITLIGLCTDICVISNALLLKAFLPEVPLIVESACCAGVTPDSHDNALAAMRVCQIGVI